ncbi:MAG: trypsin-like peptidase domain-containing protein, partial [Planctomycetota bacterium]|nr:trypsin-like peptidase domain-containing protein [Planctomycetota bacterium]
MEYCEGETLDRILERDKTLPWDTALGIVMQVARGLKHAHEHGILHRDIKPGNIFICASLTPSEKTPSAAQPPGGAAPSAPQGNPALEAALAEGFVAKILDLGLSKIVGEGESSFYTQTGLTVGTPHYISPEQARGDKQLDGRADIYSLGATLYHLVTGRTPFEGSTAASVMLKHINKELPNPQDIVESIPDGVAHVIQKMMAKDPADRYRDCKELLDDLELVIDGKTPRTQALAEGKSSVAVRRAGANVPAGRPAAGAAAGRRARGAEPTPPRRTGGPLPPVAAPPHEAAERRAKPRRPEDAAPAEPARPKARAREAELAPADDIASANRKRNIVIGAGAFVFAVSMFVILATRGGKPPASATTLPADAKPATPPTAATAPKTESTTKETKDVEPTDPQARRQWLLTQYEKYAAANPDAFGELLARLETMEKAYEKEDEWVATIEGHIRTLKQRAEKKAGDVAEALGAAAMKKADGGDYKGALAELDKFPSDLSRTAASVHVFYYRKKLSEKALAQYQGADARGQQLCDSGDFPGASRAYDAVAAFGHPQIDKLVAMRRAEVKDIAARGKNPSEGKTVDLAEQQSFFRADVYVSLPGMVVAFDAAYHEGVLGTRESAQAKIDLAQYPRSAVLYYAQATALARTGSTEEARWNAAQASRLAVPNDAFRSRLLCVDSRLGLLGADLNTAAKKAQEALQLDPKNAEALYLLGGVFAYLGEYYPPQHPEKEAFRKRGNDYLKMAIRLDPGYARLVPKALAAEAGAGDTEKYQYAGAGNPYMPSVVLVCGHTALGEGEGTGFAVRSTPTVAHIITNNHVIKGFNEFTVTYQFEALGNLVRKTSREVKVLAADPVNDLALLEVKTENEIKPLPLRPTTTGLTLPMKLTMIGHPKGLDFTVMSGELASVNRVHDGRRHLQINSNVDCGMSGGPVIDETGHVVGVTVAKIIGMGQSLAILTEHVRDLCVKAGVTVELQNPTAPAPK